MRVLLLAENITSNWQDKIKALTKASGFIKKDICTDILFLGDESCSNLNFFTYNKNIRKVFFSKGLIKNTPVSFNLNIVDRCNFFDFLTPYTHIISLNDSFGSKLIAKVSLNLNVDLITSVSSIESHNIFHQTLYSSQVVKKVETTSDKALIILNESSFSFDVSEVIEVSRRVNFIDIISFPSSKINFTTKNFIENNLKAASIIVAGGRGLGTKENFDTFVIGLAKKLDASFGATRAAIDLGFCDKSYQIGETTNIVSPKVYIALGISGAVQHLAGVLGSETIIAINSDPDANIFNYADYGYVGNIEDVVPDILLSL